MALALADSLIASTGLDPHYLMTRFVGWYRRGNYSCTGRCFDIGTTTAEALHRFQITGDPVAGSEDENAAGNGSIMRLAPVALFALHNEKRAIRIAGDQSRTTHAAQQEIEACQFFVTLLREAVLGKSDILRARLWQGHPAIRAIAAGQWKGKARDEISSSGYVITTLEAGLWSIERTESFEDALILAVNLGRDSDTVGAVTGQLAGAIYGASAIPKRWLAPLAWRERITRSALELLTAASDPS